MKALVPTDQECDVNWFIYLIAGLCDFGNYFLVNTWQNQNNGTMAKKTVYKHSTPVCIFGWYTTLFLSLDAKNWRPLTHLGKWLQNQLTQIKIILPRLFNT